MDGCTHASVYARMCVGTGVRIVEHAAACAVACVRCLPTSAYPRAVVHVIPRSTCCRAHGCRTARPCCSAPSPLLAAYPPACISPHAPWQRRACGVRCACGSGRPVRGQRLASVERLSASAWRVCTIGDERHRTLCTGTTWSRRPLVTAYGTRPELHDGHQWHSTAQPYSTAQCRGRLRRAAPARRSKDGVVADLRVQKLLCHSRAILHGVFTSRLLRRSVQNAAQRMTEAREGATQGETCSVGRT